MERGGVGGPVRCLLSCQSHRRPDTGPTIRKVKTRDKRLSDGTAGGGCYTNCPSNPEFKSSSSTSSRKLLSQFSTCSESR